VNVKKTGVYTLRLTVASGSDAGKISLAQNGAVAGKPIAVPNTGGDQNWQTAELKDMHLKAGTNTLKIIAETGRFNLKSIQFLRDE